jgi:O-antigen/teichoic acid export membrane protein
VSLRARVLLASKWVLLGYATSQVVRFGTNLVLTRLLYPEAFGLMAIVLAISLGMNLMSDLGITAGVVIHKDSDDEDYLNTAWTIQILRGLVLALALYGLAGPLSAGFGRPELQPLLEIISLASLVSGFGSVKWALSDRQIDAKRRVLLDIGNHLTGGVTTIALAWLMRSPSGLAWGIVVGSTLAVWSSHRYQLGLPHRLAWDGRKARQVVSIGALAMISSLLTFAIGEGSRLFSATMVDNRMLGLISLAGALTVMPWQAIQQISQRVLMPAYAELSRGADKARLRRVVLRARLVQIVPSWAISAVLIISADPLFRLLYDNRYIEGANILKIQCIGAMVGALSLSYNGVLWGTKRFGQNLTMQAAQGLIVWLGMYLGFQWFGALGMVVGTAAASWATYLLVIFFYGRLGLVDYALDAVVLVASAVAAFLLYVHLSA